MSKRMHRQTRESMHSHQGYQEDGTNYHIQ